MFTIILITGVIVIFVFRYQRTVQDGYAVVLRSSGSLRNNLIPLAPRYKEILIRFFPYYNNLSQKDKAKFEDKLGNIILSKSFIPRNFDQVTDEMKVLISATAVQLTFGLDRVYLSHFNKILIYPNDYYSSITKKFHKGEVNPAFGMIVLSWNSFVMGYLNTPRDGINLGIHEMAHALRLENIIRNSEYQFFNEGLLEQLDEFGLKVCERPDHDQVKFFRPYACVNTHEFFAVAIENFFERPNQLYGESPGLYNVLCALLNQNPAIYSSGASKDNAA